MPGAFKKRPQMFLLAIVPNPEVQMKRVQTTLSSAQLLALRASPVQLLAAPGPNKFYNVLGCTAVYIAGATPYNLNGNLFLLIGPALYGWTFPYLVGLLDEAFDTLVMTTPSGYPHPASQGVNVPLTITVDGASELLSGDGTVLVILHYTIESTS